jgi:hypothetical protein
LGYFGSASPTNGGSNDGTTARTVTVTFTNGTLTSSESYNCTVTTNFQPVPVRNGETYSTAIAVKPLLFCKATVTLTGIAVEISWSNSTSDGSLYFVFPTATVSEQTYVGNYSTTTYVT